MTLLLELEPSLVPSLELQSLERFGPWGKRKRRGSDPRIGGHDCLGLTILTTAASNNGNGSGASANNLYKFKNELSATLDRLVKASISPW